MIKVTVSMYSRGAERDTTVHEIDADWMSTQGNREIGEDAVLVLSKNSRTVALFSHWDYAIMEKDK